MQSQHAEDDRVGDWLGDLCAERSLLWAVIDWAKDAGGRKLDDILAENGRSRARRIQLELLRRLQQRPRT